MMVASSNLNHTAAHLLALAVLRLYPDVKLGFGPAISEGFYYDFQFVKPINDNDLIKIENEMLRLRQKEYQVKSTEPISFTNQPYKQELLNQFQAQNKKITYYGFFAPNSKKSSFTDLCAGNHVKNVIEVKHFKLLKLAGAYWRGDHNNPQLTRIYGTAWPSKQELKEYLWLLEQRASCDHRQIGKQMKLFSFNELAGKGFPIYLEDGLILKQQIKAYVRKIDKKYGFKEVETPSLGSQELYIKSGHWDYFKNDMFPIIKTDNQNLIMRPMTCPHHFLLYNATRKSYRDLPIRISEQAKLYRYEKSGALSGLERVRAMELTEGHIFCREDQILSELANAYQLIQEGLTKFNIKIDHITLALSDQNNLAKNKYHNNLSIWKKAETKLKLFLDQAKIKYQINYGEAAFYGPKIDIQVATALGHKITLSTLQLDYLLPEKFNCYYLDKNDQKIRPILIHRGFLSTYERFIAILLEQTKGVLPFWLAPKQIIIIPIALETKLIAYAQKIKQELETKLFRVSLDLSNERLSKKVRNAQIQKSKYQIIIGNKELNNQTINLRGYNSKTASEITLKEFFTMKK